ncbi:MAG: hypothetical protein JNJ73_17400 [Hyphomonadaceae bacterium]|nr:hypothetical protein [Hyphomonadaceae bacterium]
MAIGMVGGMMRGLVGAAALVLLSACATAGQTVAQSETQAVAEAPQPPPAALEARNTAEGQRYGFAVRRPIMAAACPTCVWGPFALVTKTIMAREGWDIQICWNCNQHESPRYVASGRVPHDLTPGEIELGDPPPPKGSVDFGVTNQRLLRQHYHGIGDYAADGPQPQLRLIAAFEDPAFLVVAATKSSGVTDLAQIRARRMPVRIFIGNPDDSLVLPILQHYGITRAELESWGGRFVSRQQAMANGVDVLINRSASTANNEEARIWQWATQALELNFLALPPVVLDRLVNEQGYSRVTLPLGYFRGVTQAIPTVEQSGQAVIARADMPEEDAYILAKTIDENRLEYLWSIRPFVLDPRNVWHVGDVPLHPGAARYYREVGYMR